MGRILEIEKKIFCQYDQMDEINLGNQKSVGKLIKVDKRAIYASVLLMYINFKRLLT